MEDSDRKHESPITYQESVQGANTPQAVSTDRPPTADRHPHAALDDDLEDPLRCPKPIARGGLLAP